MQKTLRRDVSQSLMGVMEYIVPNRMAEDSRSGDRMERERRGVL